MSLGRVRPRWERAGRCGEAGESRGRGPGAPGVPLSRRASGPRGEESRGPGGNGSAATSVAGAALSFPHKGRCLGMNFRIPEATSNNNNVINAARLSRRSVCVCGSPGASAQP